MRAEIGDELIFDGPEGERSGRIGTIVALTSPDGSPPYVVRWLAGYESLVFPGPQVQIEIHHKHRTATGRHRARTLPGA